MMKLPMLAALIIFSAGAASAASGERVRIAGFELDATEVTIGEFREFATATNLETEAEKVGGGFEWGSGWERRPGWTIYRPYGREPTSTEEPAVHVNWHEASAYCRWRGGRLPTFEEWHLAAYTELRQSPADGFETGRRYRHPVGDRPDGMNTRDEDAWRVHAPAGATKRGVNGLYEMGGNVWEWIADRDGGKALTAGGSWWYGPEQTTADAAQWKPADFYAVYVGFRCAYDLPA
jgi:sulfatase modifying factor 1